MGFSIDLWTEGFSFLRALGDPLGLTSPNGLPHRLQRYIDLLEAKNKQVNLTSLKDPNVVFWRHLVDSLAVCSLGDLGHVLDWGSGGGFPGIPIAIARQCRGDDCPVSFVDSVGKKARAIEDFREALGLVHGKVHWGRGEDVVSRGGSGKIDCVVMRAVAPAERAHLWISPTVGRWVLFLSPSQVDLWLTFSPSLKARGFVPIIRAPFSLPHEMGERVFLEWILQ